MKVLVIDHDEARAALVAEGLKAGAPVDVRRAATYSEAEVTAFAPDAIIIACDSPDRDTLESLREASNTNPRPVVMFTDRSTPGLAEAAVGAGVAAYVVDGFSAKRVRSVLDVAMMRFQLMQKLRDDLSKAHSDLVARKTIERAKGLLMKERGIDEDEAFKVLRNVAMNTGRPLSAVAADLVAYASVLKGKP